MAAKSGAFRAPRDDKPKREAARETARETARENYVKPPDVAASDLDRLIHERTRLAIISALAVNASLTFKELKELLRISDGNLSVHARKLEDAGYIACSKSFAGRLPKTEYRLSPSGRRAI